MDTKLLINSGYKIKGLDLFYECKITKKKAFVTNKIIEDIDIKILIPINYTPTDLTKRISSFGYLNIIKHNENTLYLNNFYIASQRYKDIADPDELIAFKGMGKSMLKLGIDLAKKYNFLKDIENSKIELTASGDMININQSDEIYNNIKNLNVETIISLYLSKNLETINFYLETNPDFYNDNSESTKRKLAKTIWMIQENYKLVDYYKFLGFHVINEENGMGISMEALIKELKL